MQRISLQDAQADLQHLIDAAINGETVLIVGEDNQAVQLVPVVISTKQRRKAGSAKGMITFADDFDS